VPARADHSSTGRASECVGAPHSLKRFVWTIGYTSQGQCPARVKAHMHHMPNMTVFEVETLKAEGGIDMATASRSTRFWSPRTTLPSRRSIVVKRKISGPHALPARPLVRT
jgi:meiotically up-regulated gene 157 (Mug157) protein